MCCISPAAARGVERTDMYDLLKCVVNPSAGGAIEIRVVDALHVRQREARLVGIRAAVHVRGAGGGAQRQPEPPDVTEPVSLEEELAAALFHDVRHHRGSRKAAAVGRLVGGTASCV